jgi:hypothetical protein
MRKVLAIFRKDVRRLWPQIAIFLSLLAILNTGPWVWAYWPEPRNAYPDLFDQFTCLLACYYLVAAAMLQESPAGDRQYWLTRPFSARHLLAEKAIFIAVFVNLAVLLAQIAALFSLGIPPLAHLDALFGSQVYLCTAFLLPAAAVFASTRNFRQVLLVGLLVLAVYGWLGNQAPGAWTAPDRLGPATLHAVIALAAGSVICFHYTRRGALLSWTVLGAMLALFILLAHTTRKAPTLREVRISLDTAVLRPRIRDLRSRPVEIPLRIEGIPPGVEASAGQVRLSIVGQSVGGSVVASAPGFAGGKARLIVPAQPYSAQTPLHLSGSVEFVLIQRLQSGPVPALGEIVQVPGVGVCTERQNWAARLTLVCLAPSERTALALEFPDRSLRWVISPRVAELPGPSFPFQPVDHFENFPSDSAGGFRHWKTAKAMVTARIVARLRGVFDFPAIRLADYPEPE